MSSNTKVATRAPAPQTNSTSQLCEYCHQKPQFSNFQYCSKTCASQAASLCNQCHKKPKYQNFDYCGKNCAALAGSKGSGAGQSAGAAATTNYPKGSNFNSQKRSQQAATQPANTIDPLQIAKLVVQHIPQVQAFLQGATAAVNGGATSGSAPPPASAPAAPTGNQAAPKAPSNNPFLNLTNQPTTQPASTSGNNVPNGILAASSKPVRAAQLHIRTGTVQQAADDPECLIPGCGKPVHADAKGIKTSDYCSMRHREEAVTSGLVSPCIMCLVLPQSDTDYFCSKFCREESMNKQFEEEEEDKVEETELEDEE